MLIIDYFVFVIALISVCACVCVPFMLDCFTDHPFDMYAFLLVKRETGLVNACCYGLLSVAMRMGFVIMSIRMGTSIISEAIRNTFTNIVLKLAQYQKIVMVSRFYAISRLGVLTSHVSIQ